MAQPIVSSTSSGPLLTTATPVKETNPITHLAMEAFHSLTPESSPQRRSSSPSRRAAQSASLEEEAKALAEEKARLQHDMKKLEDMKRILSVDSDYCKFVREASETPDASLKGKIEEADRQIAALTEKLSTLQLKDEKVKTLRQQILTLSPSPEKEEAMKSLESLLEDFKSAASYCHFSSQIQQAQIESLQKSKDRCAEDLRIQQSRLTLFQKELERRNLQPVT